jgi:hypothetical protein
MQPLLLLVAVFALLIIPLGWWNALRIALAVMFLFTASAHWGRRRADLVRMVPSAFRRPDVMVTVTGVSKSWDPSACSWRRSLPTPRLA